MPRYSWLYEQKIDYPSLEKKMKVMQKIGVPYTDTQISGGRASAEAQANTIISDLNKTGAVPKEMVNREVIALIAYVQRLGVDYGSIPEVEPVAAKEGAK